MKEIKIKIKDKTYSVKIADTDETREEGLQNIKTLPENEGMLFIFEEPQTVSFWMKDTLIPLDIIFINEELQIISVSQGEPETENPHQENDVAYVLEVNQGSNIQPGDELEFSPNTTNKMQVLNSSGESQMELEGGERIFSRPNTKSLIKFAKKAFATENDNDYRKLGKTVFKFLQIQDSNEPEYVQSKNNN